VGRCASRRPSLRQDWRSNRRVTIKITHSVAPAPWEPNASAGGRRGHCSVSHSFSLRAARQHPWQHPNRLMRPHPPRDHTIWTLLDDLDGPTLCRARLRAWSGITGWRFESSSAHHAKAPLVGAFCRSGVTWTRRGGTFVATPSGKWRTTVLHTSTSPACGWCQRTAPRAGGVPVVDHDAVNWLAAARGGRGLGASSPREPQMLRTTRAGA
jgi:hypothetical protein